MFDSLRACWNKQLHRKQSDFFRIWINSWVAVQWAPFSPFGSSTGIFQKKVPLNLYFQDHLTWQGLPLIWIISPWSATRCCSPFGFWPNNQSPEKSAFSEHPHASSLSTHKKKRTTSMFDHICADLDGALKVHGSNFQAYNHCRVDL